MTANNTDTRLSELAARWCRMWSDDPALAHTVLAPAGRQWSGVTPGLDPVVGPDATEAFVTTYRAEIGTVFRVRTLVCDASDLLAYTWDATRRGGDVITGADLNVVQDGLVVDNWTIPLTHRDERADLDGSGSASRAELVALATTEATRRGVELHRAPVADVERQSVAYLWAPADGGPGGLDVLIVRDGSVAMTSTFIASRPFAY